MECCVRQGHWPQRISANRVRHRPQCVIRLPIGRWARTRVLDYHEFVRTIIEPFRIKSVEPLRHTTPEQREQYLKDAGYNLFQLRAANILLDLLTDSGTSAMSTEQWAAMMRGDESYAGSASYYRLEAVTADLMGFRHVIPAHQGRAAERLLFTILCKPGDIVPNNTHFGTTLGNIELRGGQAIDLPTKEGEDTHSGRPFKGDRS